MAQSPQSEPPKNEARQPRARMKRRNNRRGNRDEDRIERRLTRAGRYTLGNKRDEVGEKEHCEAWMLLSQ